MKSYQAKNLVKDMEDNAGMISVYRANPDGTVSCVYRTFRVGSVLRFLRNKSAAIHTVEQQKETAES